MKIKTRVIFIDFNIFMYPIEHNKKNIKNLLLTGVLVYNHRLYISRYQEIHVKTVFA